MADEDEIDILGDYSFNSCLAQNNQGIPSCSNREDTVHPQWLLDSVSANWYDIQTKDNTRDKLPSLWWRLNDPPQRCGRLLKEPPGSRPPSCRSLAPSSLLRSVSVQECQCTSGVKDGLSRKLSGNSSKGKYMNQTHTTWSQKERDLLIKEMAKYGRNVRKISQTIKTKTEAEIQALIEAEHGVNLDTPSFGLERHEDHDDVPTVVQEEIVADDITNVNNILNIVSTGSPTISMPRKPFRKKTYNVKSKNSLLKPDALLNKTDLLAVNPSEIFYEDELILGSTESIGTEDSMHIVTKNIVQQQNKQREKMKALKKQGNHRRKVSRNYDRTRNRSKEVLKSPQGRQRKDSSLSEDSVKSPKMQIVIGPGQAVPVCDGEQVIKIEKKKDSEPESDIEIDIDSDSECNSKGTRDKVTKIEEAPIAVPLRKFEPMPKRQKKINLDGGGGYTIMHTEAGDLYEIGSEPRKERLPKKQPIHLIQCRLYNAERPAPYEVRIHVSTLIAMDAHAHTSHGEVMGLAGGRADPPGGAGGLTDPPGGARLTVRAYRPAGAAACGTHCDMDPVSQAVAAESLRALGLAVVGWHHSHPRFPPAPSALDLTTQRALQRALEWPGVPLLGIITSQHWPTGRSASQYRCIRVEDPDSAAEIPTGYQFSVKLVPDLTADTLPPFLLELRALLRGDHRDEYTVDMLRDVCPQAGITYLEKCISSISHHMRSAGYEDNDQLIASLVEGVRDVFR